MSVGFNSEASPLHPFMTLLDCNVNTRHALQGMCNDFDLLTGIDVHGKLVGDQTDFGVLFQQMFYVNAQ